MKRERPEYIWDAVRPFLIYNILFIAIRTVLSGILEYILLNPAQETVSVSLLWSEISQIAIIGITSVCAAIPLMGVGQRSIMIMRGRSEQAWITNRRDSRLLLSILPLGTLSLSVLLNLLLSESGASSEVPVSAAAIPAAAAVYGLLTPFIEELVYRGIVWYRLRKGFTPLQAALLSSLLFGVAHAQIRQGFYAFIMGTVFALSYEFTRRFEVPFLLHCTCNLTVLAASSAGYWELFRTPVWVVFFLTASLAVFVYWGMRIAQSKYRL